MIKTWDEKKKRILRKEMPNSFKKMKLSNSNLRNWLAKQGKEKYIDFNNKERRQYKKIFDALDADGSKAIGVSELEDPLIALGFADSREYVENLINDVDKDGTGEIEFEEFLLIMKEVKKKEIKKKETTGEEDDSNSLYKFFQDMVEGNFSKRGDLDNDIPFVLNYSQYRRKMIINAIIHKDTLEDKKKKEKEIDENNDFSYNENSRNESVDSFANKHLPTKKKKGGKKDEPSETIESLQAQISKEDYILRNFGKQMETRRIEEKKERLEDAKKSNILKTLGGAQKINQRTGFLSFKALKEATKRRMEAKEFHG